MATAAGTASAAPTFEELIATSHVYLEEQQVRLQTQFALSSHERWDFDQEKGELVFSNKGLPAVVAKFQFVGSFSVTSNTWHWSWTNSSVVPELSKEVEAVRAYGDQHGFQKLAERKWEATEADGWDMAANQLSTQGEGRRAKGVYRPPFAQGVTFLVITDIRRVEQ